MKCEYCSGDKYLLERSRVLSNKGDFYPGVDFYIDEGRLEIVAVPNTHEPVFMEESVGIKFCPMCGRKFEEGDR